MTISNRIVSSDSARPGYLCFLIVVLVAGTGCSRNNASQARAATPAAAPVLVSPAMHEVKREESESAGEIPSQYSRWRVSFPPESVHDSSIPVAAAVDSDRAIQTLSGPRLPLLVLLCANRELRAYIGAHSAAETVSVEGGRRAVPIQVQYDSQPPRTLLATQSTDYESFFLPNPKNEVRSIEKASTLRVSFKQFQASRVEFSFDVSLFEDARKALKEQCPATP